MLLLISRPNIYFLLHFSGINHAPSSPFKKPLNLNHHHTSAAFGFSSNGSDSGSSMVTTSSSSGRQTSSSSSGAGPMSLLDSPFQSGHLPTIADVRSPDVLQCSDGPCDCISHPIKVIIWRRNYFSYVKKSLIINANFYFTAFSKYRRIERRNEKPWGPNERPKFDLTY